MLRSRLRIPLRSTSRPLSSRCFTSPTTSRSAQPALRETEELGKNESWDSSLSRLPQLDSVSRTWSATTPNPYNGANRQYISLPNLLPADARAQASQEHQMLYPTSGVLDSTSMIGICLRRTEHIPRAYSIFRKLLADYNAGSRALPSADVFGKVVEGVSMLGKEGMPQFENWRSKAERIVEQWEEAFHGKPAHLLPTEAVKENDGIKVYQGWFSGLVLSQSGLDSMIPYFANSTLTAEELMAGVAPEYFAQCLAALKQLHEITRMEGLARSISLIEGKEREQQERLARDVIPEINAIKANEGYGKKVDVANLAGPRFAVTNLRSALAPLQEFAPPIIRQRSLEESSLEAARAELENSFEASAGRDHARSGRLAQDQLQSWMHEWLLDLTDKLNEDIAEMAQRVKQIRPPSDSTFSAYENYSRGFKARSGGDSVLLMYLQVLEPSKLALITILEVMRAVGGSTGSADAIKAIRAMQVIGKGVETEHQAQLIRDIDGADSKLWQQVLDPTSQKPVAHLIQSAWDRIGRGVKDGTLRIGEVDWSEVWTPAWSQQAHLDLGSYLLVALLQAAKVKRTAIHPKTNEEVSETQPAFAHSYEYVKGRKVGIIRLNPAVAERMSLDRLPSMISPKHLPMLVEPRKWEAFDRGGYLMHKVPIMRVRESTEQTPYLKAAIGENLAEAILHGLDVLSSTAWKINRGVFDVMLECWNNGDAIAKIPASEEKSNYTYPERPELDADPRARADYLAEYKDVMAQQKKDHGERCKINYTLEVARSFLHDTFFLPHNMDFRGRCYPIPPHLSPVGDDLNRGLLLFAEGRELGENGLRWLQIHLANVYGYDKVSFDDRARFAEDHVADIFDSADNPLTGNRWWLAAEDPWQCLAVCKEIAAALRSGDPTKHVSHFPVHQDGTCNGMQHYAALGGDVRGARAVNLEDGDKPADIYTRVVDIVNKVIEGDQKLGNELALAIKEPLTRKVVKQTVMTTVYGVTFVGARDQIAKQLALRTDMDKKQIFPVSGYVAKTVLSCIGDLFAGARDIQDWLTTCARLISRSIPPSRLEQATMMDSRKSSRGRSPAGNKIVPRLPKELMTSVVWTTPLGLPVVQPYRKAVKKQVMTALQSVYVSDPNQLSEVSTMKQASAFPPNYIHSLDATHMFLTALRCKQNNVTFASVHDSYWTHAATVGEMSRLIRASFIQLHEADLIGQLREEFLDRYGDNYIPVANAKKMAKSLKERVEKEQARRDRVRLILSGTDLGEAATPAEATEAHLAEVLGQVPVENDIDGIDGDSDVDVDVDADLDVEVAASEDDPVPVGEVAISGDEVQKLANAQGQALKVHKVGMASFVKLRDLLPPQPVRGDFDVRKIETSSYFFS